MSIYNNIKKCDNCNLLIKSKSNKIKYCKQCAKEIEKENVRKRVQKYRILHKDVTK